MSERVARMLDGTEAQGMGIVLAVLEHVEAEPPKPWTVLCAAGQMLDGDGAVWEAEGGQAVRLLALSCACGCTELTSHKSGVEIARFIARLE